MELVLAISKAGHDKGKTYIISHKDEEFYYLVDGKIRPVDGPKKKRFRHVQPIKKLPEKVKSEAEELSKLTDYDARKLIKMYEKTLRGETDV